VSRELRRIEICITVNSCERLPEKDGEQMYAEDVVEELDTVVRAAAQRWYQDRGHQLLACEPN
jgi:hypothetical protein